jgi:hypothetical protein
LIYQERNSGIKEKKAALLVPLDLIGAAVGKRGVQIGKQILYK